MEKIYLLRFLIAVMLKFMTIRLDDGTNADNSYNKSRKFRRILVLALLFSVINALMGNVIMAGIGNFKEKVRILNIKGLYSL